eukprot:9489382-Pyramimonas_sp.AAC.1
MFDWAKLELKQKLGSGSYSDVHLAVLKGSKGQPDMNVAIKMDTSGASALLIKEAKMVCELKHKNLVRIFGVTTQPIALVSEVLPNGSLSSMLRKHGGVPVPLGMTHTLKILRDIAEGLQFLHSQQPPIVHRDLRDALGLDIDFKSGMGAGDCSAPTSPPLPQRNLSAVGTLSGWQPSRLVHANGCSRHCGMPGDTGAARTTCYWTRTCAQRLPTLGSPSGKSTATFPTPG